MAKVILQQLVKNKLKIRAVLSRVHFFFLEDQIRFVYFFVKSKNIEIIYILGRNDFGWMRS